MYNIFFATILIAFCVVMLTCLTLFVLLGFRVIDLRGNSIITLGSVTVAMINLMKALLMQLKSNKPKKS